MILSFFTSTTKLTISTPQKTKKPQILQIHTMLSLKFHIINQSPFLLISSNPLTKSSLLAPTKSSHRRRIQPISCIGQEPESKNSERRRVFLTLEEAGLVEMSNLSTHERFLCRLTISSLNLLRAISEEEGCAIEELNAGKVCDWFVKDKLRREENIESAVLQWDDSEFQF